MCGIAGLVWKDITLPVPAHAAVALMCDRMSARGPDASGYWCDRGVALGHRRLAILDLDARANQPMTSGDGRYRMVFNGEIYNFRELRGDLERHGTIFRTASDTEVILALFDHDREAMLPRLRGMFALAIWDAKTRELFLARDPYGIKPLYYGRFDGGVAFASQVKALIASRLIETTREPAGAAGFFLWGSVPEPLTLYRDVRALPAGHFLRVVRDARMESPVRWQDVRRYWDAPKPAKTAAEAQEVVREAVADSVKAHLISDVPISVFLSGGTDSTAVLGVLRDVGADPEAITIGFDEFRGLPADETPAAAAAASRHGVRHHIRIVSREEFKADLPRIVAAMDQPSVDGVNTWFASKAASERGYKVALSGVGADELFCGYSTFDRIPKAAAAGRLMSAVPRLPMLLRRLARPLANLRSQPKLAGFADLMSTIEGLYLLYRGLFLPSELAQLIGEDAAAEGLKRLENFGMGTGAGQVRAAAGVAVLESSLYLRNQLLRDADWASMAHSLEVRTPLVDSTLSQRLAPFLPFFRGGRGKAMLAYSASCPPPISVLKRSKTGFGVPMGSWITNSDMCIRTVTPNMSWARRWALSIMEHMAPCI